MSQPLNRPTQKLGQTTGIKPRVWLAIAGFAVVLGVVGYAQGWFASGGFSDLGSEALKKGDAISLTRPKPAEDFELKDHAGRSHRLKEFRGKSVMVHFWASWCPPCIEELPEWMALTKAYAGKSVAFVSVSADKSWDEALKLLPEADTPTNVTALLDTEAKVPEQFGSYQFPETYWLNAKGEVAAKWVGPQDWKSDAMKKKLDGLLAE